jgi:hypothetical protein
MRESMDVVWYHNMKSTLWTIDFSDFKNFHVVTKNITGHLKRSYNYNFNLWIFKTKYSTKLGIFSL